MRVIIIGGGYFNFKGRDGLIKEVKRYVSKDHYLVRAVKDTSYMTSLNQLCALRNYAAHYSMASKKLALKATGQRRMKSAGSWLKRQSRFYEIVLDLAKLSKAIEEGARTEGTYQRNSSSARGDIGLYFMIEWKLAEMAKGEPACDLELK